MRGLLKDCRWVFRNIDRIYYEQSKLEIMKLSDDLIFALKNAMRKRLELLDSLENSKNELNKVYNEVRKSYKEFVSTGVSRR